MKKHLFGAALSATIILSGCGSIPAPERSTEDSFAPPAPAAALKRTLSSPVEASAERNAALFTAENGRLMAWSAEMTIRVKDIARTEKQLHSILKKYSGYLQSQHEQSYTLKIPSSSGQAALDELRGLGTEENFSFIGEDLTDAISDLDVRMNNLRNLQKRLTELLQTSKTVKDTLSIEKELARITTELDLLLTRQKQNRNRVDFISIDLTLILQHSPVKPQNSPDALSFYPWLRNLLKTQNRSASFADCGLKLPAGFTALPENGNGDQLCSCAISSDDCLLKVSRRDLPEGSTQEFWHDLIIRALEEFNDYTFSGEDQLESGGSLLSFQSRDKSQTLYLVIKVKPESWFSDGELLLLQLQGKTACTAHQSVLKELSGDLR